MTTFAAVPVSVSAFAEVAGYLNSHGYESVVSSTTIDMRGLGLKIDYDKNPFGEETSPEVARKVAKWLAMSDEELFDWIAPGHPSERMEFIRLAKSAFASALTQVKDKKPG